MKNYLSVDVQTRTAVIRVAVYSPTTMINQFVDISPEEADKLIEGLREAIRIIVPTSTIQTYSYKPK